ncbi:MAG: hypothetical protein HY691_09040 [Chloroflexi bacterium]|nr:hypothetical protein [Chloroflexota bacterium]
MSDVHWRALPGWMWAPTLLALALAGCAGPAATATPQRPAAPAEVRAAASPAPSPAPLPAAATPLPPTPAALPPTPMALRPTQTSAPPTPTALPASPTPRPSAPAPKPTPPPAQRPAGPAAPSFARDVLPIFQQRCVVCHSGPNAPRELRLTSYENVLKGTNIRKVILPGRPDQSILVDAVDVGYMPLGGPPLDRRQVELIRAWVAAGAPNS